MKINVIYISLTQHMANKISGQMCSVVICRHTVLSKIIKSKQMFHSLSICRLKRFGLPLQYARRLNKDYSIILTRCWEWFTYFDIIFIDRFKGILFFFKKEVGISIRVAHLMWRCSKIMLFFDEMHFCRKFSIAVKNIS